MMNVPLLFDHDQCSCYDRLPVVRPLTVNYRPIDSLVPDPRNARTHSKRQVEQIIASIRISGSPTQCSPSHPAR